MRSLQRSESLAESPTRREAVAYGKIVAAFIRAGWNPPRPSERVVERITSDIERLDRERRWGEKDVSPTLELTATEHRVLALLAEGRTQNEIARETRRGYEGVRESTKGARRKLGARNTTHAVAIAMRRGLLT